VLPWTEGDDVAAQEQLAAISKLLALPKITATEATKIGATHAWYARLQHYALENLDTEVSDQDWSTLQTALYKDFGSKETDRDWARFVALIDSLNTKALEARNFQLMVSGLADLPDKLAPESVDWVITDPPYGQEHLPRYGELAALAAKVLKPGGSLLVMAGQSYLPEVLAQLSGQDSLHYFWTLSYLTPGGQSPFVKNGKVNTFWKPVFWLVKGEYEGKAVGDVPKSDRNDNDKTKHHWGQSESGFADIMTRFVSPGDMVLDPMVGGGTSAVVARALNCKFIGSDSDPQAIETTRGRLRDG
jgi:site-specific DNA-methyltransferase (adenine-specific)